MNDENQMTEHSGADLSTSVSGGANVNSQGDTAIQGDLVGRDKIVQVVQPRLEYDKLKSEQADRLGFRNRLIYVTIITVSGVFAFAFADPANYIALLIVPWAMLILGWTYLVNDEKISAIGRYIRLTLVPRIKPLLGEVETEALLGWEFAHRSDKRRGRRKIEQLLIDEITFVLPGLVALLLYWVLTPAPPVAALLATLIEVLLLVFLGTEIVIYADLAKGR